VQDGVDEGEDEAEDECPEEIIHLKPHDHHIHEHNNKRVQNKRE